MLSKVGRARESERERETNSALCILTVRTMHVFVRRCVAMALLARRGRGGNMTLSMSYPM